MCLVQTVFQGKEASAKPATPASALKDVPFLVLGPVKKEGEWNRPRADSAMGTVNGFTVYAWLVENPDYFFSSNCKPCEILWHLNFQELLLLASPAIVSHRSQSHPQLYVTPLSVLLYGMLPIPNSCSQRTEFGCRTTPHMRLLPSLQCSGG